MTDCAAPRHDDPVQAEAHAHLCGSCKAGLRRDLRRLPALASELTDQLDPRRSTCMARTGADGSGMGLPYNDPAAECISQIRHDLAWWTWEIASQRGWEPPAKDSIPAMAGWLVAQVTWCAFRPWAGDLAAAFAADRGRSMAVIDPMPRADIPIPADVNYCPRCGHTMCLYATVYQSAGDRRQSLVTCGNCLHEWDAVQWLRLGQTIIAWRDAQRKEAA